MKSFQNTFISPKLLIVTTALLATLWAQPYRIMKVDGQSMEPTLHDGQLILIKRFDGNINKNDLAIISDPEPDKDEKAHDIVKRVKYVEGETYYGVVPTKEMTSWIYIYWTNSDIETLKTIRKEKICDGVPIVKFVVDKDKCFLQGDNIEESTDSRMFGQVKVADIEFTVIL